MKIWKKKAKEKEKEKTKTLHYNTTNATLAIENMKSS